MVNESVLNNVRPVLMFHVCHRLSLCNCKKNVCYSSRLPRRRKHWQTWGKTGRSGRLVKPRAMQTLVVTLCGYIKHKDMPRTYIPALCLL